MIAPGAPRVVDSGPEAEGICGICGAGMGELDSGIAIVWGTPFVIP